MMRPGPDNDVQAAQIIKLAAESWIHRLILDV